MSAPPNLDDTFAFLQALEPNVFKHEFCWFKQYMGDGPVRQWYAPFNEGTLERLTDENQHFGNIFVCVNAIDVPVYDGDYAKRPASAVTRVRAVFGDFDDPNVPLPEFALEPSMVVQTSPGKHHVYWLTRDTPVAAFKGIQLAIIAKYRANGSDRSIQDLSRVMRVPGLWHMKDPRKARLVRLLHDSGAVYSHDELRAAFPHAPEPTRAAVSSVPCEPCTPIAALVLSFVCANGEEAAPGKFNLACPWSDQHTTNPDGGTSYFTPSTLNGGRGGFKCLHSHCSHRDIHEFSVWVYQFCQGTL